MKTSFEHATEKARKEYLENRPNANPKLHTVKEVSEDSSQKEEKTSLKEQLKNLGSKTKKTLNSLPENAQRAFFDKKYRQELKGDMIGILRKEKDRFIEKGMKSVTGQFTETADGVKALLKGEKPTVKQVEAMVRMGIKMSVVGTAAMTGGASAGAMALGNTMVIGSVVKFFKGYGVASAKENVLEGLKETIPAVSEMNAKYTNAKSWFKRIKDSISNFGGNEIMEEVLSVMASEEPINPEDEEAVKEFMSLFIQMITEIMEQTELTTEEMFQEFDRNVKMSEKNPSKIATRVADRYLVERVVDRYLDDNGSI